jgi:Domain of unknown function (DUF4494)
MEQYYRVTVKVSFEDKKGNTKFKKESYIVFAVSPTDVESKIAKELSSGDYEILGINTTSIIDIIK